MTKLTNSCRKLVKHETLPSYTVYFLKDFIYLFMRDTERKRDETQAEGEAGSMQGARRGT